MRRLLVGALTTACGVCALLVFSLILVLASVLALLVPRLSWRRAVTHRLAGVAVAVLGVRLVVEGLERIPPGSSVVVANHSSYLDGVAMKAALPPRFSFVIKREAASMPMAGFLLKRIGSEFVDRHSEGGRRRDAMRVLRRAGQGHDLVFARSDMEAPRAWQFECLDDAGSPLLRAANFNNIYFPVPQRFYEFRRDPLQGWLGQRAITTANPDVLLWQLSHFSEKFCNQSSGIFLRIAAHALLSSAERKEWSEFATPARQRRRWLHGRACIKEAVRFWIFQKTGRLLYPADIIVLQEEKGAPSVDGVWATSLIPPPEVSLSHQGDRSLVAVAPPQHPVGVDVEHRERIMDTDLIRGALSPHEQLLLQGFSGEELRERHRRSQYQAIDVAGVMTQGSHDLARIG